jgi:hypothetical protein
MVLDSPLGLIGGWGDREIHRPVDQTDARSAGATPTFGDNIQKLSRGLGTRFLLATAREHPFFMADFKLDGMPFRCQTSDDGFSLHAKQRAHGPMVHRRAPLLHFRRRSVNHSGGF